MVDSIAPQRSLTLPGLTAGLGVLVAVVLGYGWWSTGQNVTALDKRTTTLESSAGGTASAVDLQKLQLDQADLAKKLDAVATPDMTGLTALTGDVAALKTAVSDLTSKIGDAPAKLGALETRIAAMEARAPTDLTQVTADLAEVKTGLATLKTQIGDFAPATLAALATQVSDLTAKIPPAEDSGQLATVVAALGGQIETLRTQVGDVSADKITTLQGNVTALQGNVTGLTDRVATLSTGIGAAASASDLSALQTRLDEFAKTMPPATNIEPLAADVGSLKTRVANLETSGTADGAIVAALGAQLDGLTARVGAVETASPAADLATIKADLAGLRSEIGSLAKSADVATLQAAVQDLQLKPRLAVTQPKVLAQIYFDRGSYKLVDASVQALDALAKDLLANPRDVAIMGFSDTQGPVEFNRALSVRRASAVRKALIGQGIATSMVTALTGLGEDGPPVVTDDGTPERGNRTVLVLANN